MTSYTVALHKALALAATNTGVAEAQQEYLLAVRQVLATSQVQTYAVLVQKFSGTMQPLLDNIELAVC